jgi:hypothetical protein
VQVLLVALAALFAVEMVRTVPIASIILAPLFASAVDQWLTRSGMSFMRQPERWQLLGAAAVALVCIGLVVPSTAEHPARSYPLTFDRQLDELPSSAVLLNELGDGGYLTWSHPDLRIIIDGLSDQYSTAYLFKVYGGYQLEPGWEDFVKESGATHALLKRDAPLAEVLERSGWTEVAYDEDRVLLVH